MIDFFAGLPTNQAPFALDISNNFHNDNDSGDNDGDGDGDDDGISKAPPRPPMSFRSFSFVSSVMSQILGWLTAVTKNFLIMILI